ncbi:putative sugar nucleotidyl transferase [Parapedobacter indicus]|uniref:UDP-N-acetylglucosamine diphosphorylase/glucosamine-1-phosphate N-acetyltransferase n=1 Tax=Parapedobacter indicus TaxID=1477437 RepID=A0A1I3JB31_9SPHI|nr:putative sugar nucleotidyl transferase [Parapedobacter indicus]PPL02452.1 UDP-N-acetylglucosamine diphosphorylase/glucosamine-1-phosphate N-acetyltransferase [Parapedobacter indicus]SFI57336.1 UDP-N-acetylglucosamine diphosphorylase/glucosamine-1-phosphate N-acetyltransferase [Parapedobacter indicus]
MHIVLFDKADWRMGLYPLSLTRPVSDLRVGILTIAEKWGKWLDASYSFLTEDYLAEKYPLGDLSGDVWVIRGNCCPNSRLFDAIMALQVGQMLMSGAEFIAFRGEAESLFPWHPSVVQKYSPVAYEHSVVMINHPEDLFLNNGQQIGVDFDLLTRGRSSASLSSSNRFLGEQIFAEEGAQAEFATFNSTKGPIYLGKNSEVWEGSHIRGAFALGDHSQVKMGAKIYSNVTVGPYSRVGGELNTCVIWGRSAKGHDGYLGSAVMGEWCNWGADTNNSNLKNNYKSIRLYDYRNSGYRDSGLQFCGAIMADHVRCAVNTTFNTGTVVGVGANVFGAGMPPTYVPDFSWAGPDGFSTYRLDKFFETASLVYERRNLEFNETERKLLTAVFELTRKHRNQVYIS